MGRRRLFNIGRGVFITFRKVFRGAGRGAEWAAHWLTKIGTIAKKGKKKSADKVIRRQAKVATRPVKRNPDGTFKRKR